MKAYPKYWSFDFNMRYILPLYIVIYVIATEFFLISKIVLF